MNKVLQLNLSPKEAYDEIIKAGSCQKNRLGHSR